MRKTITGTAGRGARKESMKTISAIAILWVTAGFAMTIVALRPTDTAAKLAPLLKVNKQLDKRTVIKKSLIPGAGNGLFAAVKLKQGQVIGELGGRLVQEFPHDNHYVAALLDCALKEAAPYKYLDSKDYGAHVSRINFAPSKINGIETHFQNARLERLCKHPFVHFVALRDIQPGEEIWSSYGPNYDYERFMKIPEVRDFFCGRLKTDCRETYSYEH
jgi:SET domain-containing protein